MRSLLSFSVGLIFLLGCGASKSSNNNSSIDMTGWPSGPISSWNGFDLQLPDGSTSNDQDRALNAFESQILAWEADFGTDAPKGHYGVVSGDCTCGGSGNYGGCWRGKGFILITAGLRFDLWPAYHETCHAYLFQTTGDADSQHSNPKWVTWNNRGEELKVLADSK